MASAMQMQAQRELDSRIPRGLRGSKQNEFRFDFYFFRSQGMTFDDSVQRAVETVKQREPNFEPRIIG